MVFGRMTMGRAEGDVGTGGTMAIQLKLIFSKLM